ncbi:MAG: glutamate carboxypeptidase [Rubrivivax sp.]|nr:glutamate carboxypeptidase [Rubrivivax sp.]
MTFPSRLALSAAASSLVLWLGGCAQPGPGAAPAASPPAAAAPARSPDSALMAAAQADKGATVKTLERLVDIETGTGNAEGMAAMADLLEAELRALGATVTRHQPDAGVAGQNLVGRIQGRGTQRILLMAHMDTVYAKGTLAKAPFRIEGDRAYGPGIADDKGGVAIILHTLRLLKARGFDGFGELVVMFNTDEEKGSFGSRALIQQLASQADFVLSFEPTQAGKESLVLGTAGIVYYKVAVKGLAAHAGANPELGVNALVEASDIVLRTMDLDDKANNLRFNWTVAKAGAVPNIIPDQASLEANIRYSRSEDLDKLLATLEQRIQGHKKLPKSQITITPDRGRPAFNANAGGRRLVEQAVAIYKEAGGTLAVVPQTGGGTDAAYAALSGKPVIESLGLPGFGYHSDQAEYVDLDAIPRRLYLAVRLIEDLSSAK